MVDVLEKQKLNCETYHLQELSFSKLSNVRNINSSFGNLHLTLILYKAMSANYGCKRDCDKYISVMTTLSPAPEAPLQLIKCGCSKSVCKTSRLTIYIVPICVEDPCKNIASEE